MQELFAYIFGINIKFGYKNPSILIWADVADKISFGLPKGLGLGFDFRP